MLGIASGWVSIRRKNAAYSTTSPRNDITKMDTQNVSIFVLAINHLFNFDGAFARLAFDDLFCGDARLPHLGIANDQLHELRVIGTIIEK